MFSVPFLINKYEGYIVATLLVEFNTIFLRLRLILGFVDIDKSTLTYKIVSQLNLGNFLFFFMFKKHSLFIFTFSDLCVNKNIFSLLVDEQLDLF